MTVVELLAGLVYLLLGGDLIVRGAVSLADRWGLSPALVGVTIVAIGTSAPELVVSVQAALTGHSEIALGNVVGSNIANMLLVVGTLAIVCGTASEDRNNRSAVRAMLVATALLLITTWDGALTRLDGLVIIAGLPLFLADRIRHVRRGSLRIQTLRDGRIEWVLGHPTRTWLILVFLIVGAACLPLGAELLVGAAQTVALGVGVSEAVVGSTIVAAGTSLPELATVIVAGARREIDVALGNAVGSNVFNVIVVMGVATVAAPLSIGVPSTYRWVDLPVMTASAILVGVFALRGEPIRRPLGIALVGAYAVYVAALYLRVVPA